MSDQDRRYYARRAAEEQALAETATEIHARDAHLQLSRAYLEKASTGDRDSPAHEEIG